MSATAKKEKRWLKSVADPNLVEFFQDSQFDASDYATGFYEQREASHAAHRVEKLEGLKRQTEEALRAEVVRNYKAFMHATEEIRSMETGIQTLKDLLASTATTLQTFRSVRLVEAKPQEKGATGSRSTARTNGSGSLGVGGVRGNFGGIGGGTGESAADDDIESDAAGPSRGLKLPEWLDQAPIELEELLLERKHQAASTLIKRVREFSGNVQNANNLGRGVERIFQRVETMAEGLADRLLSEIAAANTLTVWGFREHKSNFALLISLGHGEKAAVSFVGERSAMIRRSLRLVEVTADPLSYVGTLSDTFFQQVSDAVTAFLKLFCGSAKIHQRRANKSGKSIAYYQVYQGVKNCGTAPFCRLVVWMNQQIDQYALLVGRQVRTVTMGPQRILRSQFAAKKGGGAGGSTAAAAGGSGGGSGSWVAGSGGEDPGFRLGPVAASLFSIVSLMLEEAFAAAGRLTAAGFPVGVQLASRLVPDVSFFLQSYVDNVKENLVAAIKKDPFVGAECRLVPPEALAMGTAEEEERKARKVRLTSSARIMVLEARDILDYALVLLEPPSPEEEALAMAGEGAPAAGVGVGGGSSGHSVAANASPESNMAASYYTRDEFLELEPVVVSSLEQLLRTYLKETTACMRSRRDNLSTDQALAASANLREVGGCYVPLLASWCAELLPEIADEEEVTNLRALETEFQRSASNPLRPRETSSSSSLKHAAGSSSSRAPRHSTSSSTSTGAASAAVATGAAALTQRSSTSSAGGGSARLSVDSTGVGSARASLSSRRESEAGTGAASGAEGTPAPTHGHNRRPSLEERRGGSRTSGGAAAASTSSRTSAAEAAAQAAAAAAAAASSYRPKSSEFRPTGGPRTQLDPSSTSSGRRSASPSSVTTRTTLESTSARESGNSGGGSTPSSSSSSVNITHGGFRNAASSGTSTSTGTTGASPSRSGVVNITHAGFRNAASSSSSTGTTGGGSSAVTPPLPATMRRPVMTLKAAREAKAAKEKAAAEAKAKAAANK